jgi:hypothetical protein
LVLLVAALIGRLPLLVGVAQEPATETPPLQFDDRGVSEVEVGRSVSLFGDTERHLSLWNIYLLETATVDSTEYRGAQVLSVDEGSIEFTIASIDPETAATISRDPNGNPCEGGCNVADFLGTPITLQPGDTLIHDGPIVYSYRYAGTSAVGAVRAASGAPNLQQPSGKATKACASGC